MKIITVLLIAITMLFASCSDDNPVNSNKDIKTQIDNLPKEELSEKEKESMIFMREEEKLAYDVYTTLYEKWNKNIFANIAESELTHTTAVLNLLEKYELEDPVGNNEIGVFTDTVFQNLYNQLVEQGSKSELDALIIGATIEDLDIYDLNEWQQYIDNEDITFVFDNLTKGSRNHLRSFYSQINQLGGEYTAQYLSQEELNAIIDSEKETGAW
jgi:hypothetical protein